MTKEHKNPTPANPSLYEALATVRAFQAENPVLHSGPEDVPDEVGDKLIELEQPVIFAEVTTLQELADKARFIWDTVDGNLTNIAESKPEDFHYNTDRASWALIRDILKLAETKPARTCLNDLISRLDEVSDTLSRLNLSEIAPAKLRTLEHEEKSLAQTIQSMKAITQEQAAVQMFLTVNLAVQIIDGLEEVIDNPVQQDRQILEGIVFDVATLHRVMYSALGTLLQELPAGIAKRHMRDIQEPFDDDFQNTFTKLVA